MESIPNELELAATELSAITALLVAFSFATSGAFFLAAVAGLIGAALFVAYHFLEVEFLHLEEEQIREFAEAANENFGDMVDGDDTAED